MEDVREIREDLRALYATVSANHIEIREYMVGRNERDKSTNNEIATLRDRARRNSDRFDRFARETSDRFSGVSADINEIKLWRAKAIGVIAGVSFISGIVGSLINIFVRTMT